MSVFGQLASLMIRPEKDAGFEDTFASRFGAAPLSAEEAAAMRLRQGVMGRQQGEGAPRAERVMGALADLSKSLGEPVTRITDYSRSRVGTEAPLTEEDVFRQDLASRNIGKGVAQFGAYGLPLKNPAAAVPSQFELRGGQLTANTPKTTPTVVQGIRAYHGSPHDFDRFDLSKIGTGEGAQAYGHGLYFAENEGVARGYRDAVTKARSQELPDAGYFNLREPIDTYGTGLSQLNDKFRQMGAGAEGKIDQATILRAIDAELAPHYSGRFKGPVAADTMKKWEEARKFVEARPEMSWRPEPYKGRMYEVSLNARPEQFLDWDRPLSQQPSGVANPLQTILRDRERMPADWIKSSPGAEGRLREAGIPGIRYLDQGSRPHFDAYQAELKKYQGLVEDSRNKLKADPNNQSLRDELIKTRNELNRIERVGPGTSNYVVFDPGIIDILRKYGLAGATAAPFGALAAQDSYKQ